MRSHKEQYTYSDNDTDDCAFADPNTPNNNSDNSTESPPSHQHPVNRTSGKSTQPNSDITRNSVIAETNRAPTRRRLGRACKKTTDYSEFF